MIIEHQMSGSQVLTPAADSSTLFVNPAGIVQIKHSTGRISTAETGKLSMSGLIDVDTAAWTSGYLPTFNGNYFAPAAIPASGGGMTLTTTTSGQVEVRVLLASGFLTSSAIITFSGIDQSYDVLEIQGLFRDDLATGAHTVQCYFNNDTTTTNYLGTNFRADEFSWFGQSIADSVCATAHAQDKDNTNYGLVNPGHFFIPNYAATNRRKWLYAMPCQWEHTAGVETNGYITLWKSTAGINMITLKLNQSTNTLSAGTQVYLYGRKRQWVVMSGTLGGTNISHGLLVP